MSRLANALGHLRPLIAATAAAAAFSALPMSAAHADYVPPGSPGTVSASTVEANGNVMFSGSGFAARELIDITVKAAPTATAAAASTGGATPHIQLIAYSVASTAVASTVKADASGSFSTSVHLATVGTYWLVATGRTSAHLVSAVVKVVPKANGSGTQVGGKGGAGGGLSFTGAPVNFATVAWLGVGAISLGIAFLRLSATRRRQEGLVQPSGPAL